MITWPKPAEESRLKVYATNFLNYVNFDFVNNCLKSYFCPKISRKSYWTLYSMFVFDFLSKHKLIIIMSFSIFSILIFMYFFGKKNSWIRSKILISLKDNEPFSDKPDDSLDKKQISNNKISILNSTEVYEDNELNSDVNNTRKKTLNNSTDQNIDENKSKINFDIPENKEKYDLINKSIISNETPHSEIINEEITSIDNNHNKNQALKNKSVDSEQKVPDEGSKELKTKKETENIAINEINQNSIESKIVKSIENQNENENQEKNSYDQNIDENKSEIMCDSPENREKKSLKNESSISNETSHSEIANEEIPSISKISIPIVHEKSSQSSLRNQCRAPFRSSFIKDWQMLPKSDQSEIKSVKINNVQVDVKLSNQPDSNELNRANYYFDKIDNYSY